MRILKKIAIFLGLLTVALGISLSQATAMQTLGHGKNKLFCITGTFVMPKDIAIIGGKVDYLTSTNFYSAQQRESTRRCSSQGKVRKNYYKAPMTYLFIGPYQLKVLAVLCSSNGGAYEFRRTLQKPRSFVYHFKQSDHISSHHPLFRKYCRK